MSVYLCKVCGRPVNKTKKAIREHFVDDLSEAYDMEISVHEARETIEDEAKKLRIKL